MKTIRLGVIGYGVRIDMLMDQVWDLPVDVKVTAVADKNPDRVRELMTKNGAPEVQHRMEIDKIDGMLRKCPMDPDAVTFYEDAQEMLDKEELDGVIQSFAKGWNVSRMNHTDKNIMRLALCELVYPKEETAPSIVLNEAILLAKEYSGEKAAKFINGILGAYVRSRS